MKKQCKCCLGIFATGKDYGSDWAESHFRNPSLELGLCEFCNPANEKWYIKNKQCHGNSIQNQESKTA